MATRRTETTSLWTSNEVCRRYETTTKSSFIDKSHVLKDRHIVKEKYEDKLWFLGYEDKDIYYRRKRLLAPLSMTLRKNVEGPTPDSTHKLDFNALEFTPAKSNKDQGRVAGLVTISKGAGLTYGSEQFYERSTLSQGHRKKLSIFHDHYTSGTQMFRDDVATNRWSTEREQISMRRPVESGLTIPITHQRYERI